MINRKLPKAALVSSTNMDWKLEIQSLSSKLPPEIEDLIFEWAARLNPRHAPALSVLSKRIQACVELVMYESLYIGRPGEISSGPENAKQDELYPTSCSRSIEFFTTHVRNVFLPFVASSRIIESILPNCLGIRRVVIFRDDEGCGKWIPSTSTLSWLYIDKCSLREMVENGTELLNLTFLGIHHIPFGVLLPSFESFPALETVELDIEHAASDDHYLPMYQHMEHDIERVLSTVAQLRLFRLNLDLDSLEDTKWYMAGLAIPTNVKVKYRNADTLKYRKRWRSTNDDSY
ncbi:hypothetical protein H0H92_007646 [Tricholoma furcatifolium]|nr:hypothetical protein H0H92_007646 [Tricholoma furcatifolium]